MPLYPFRCAAGHETERFYHMTDKRPTTVRCRCGKRARRAVVRPGLIRGALSFEAHYNPCVDRVVTSDRDFNDAVKRQEDLTGTKLSPYEGPVRPRSDNWKQKGAAAAEAVARMEHREFAGEDGLAEEVVSTPA
jgi:hypothetical protein